MHDTHHQAPLIEKAKALEAELAKACQYNIKQLDASELRRAELHQFMLEQNSLIQDMKYQFNLQIITLRQAFSKKPDMRNEIRM